MGLTNFIYWDRRVEELFPNRNIIVEMGMELFGEFGLSITLYEEEKWDI